MSIANEIAKAQYNLKDCYNTCKDDNVVFPDHKNFDNLPALIEQYLNPFNKPSDWSDIRTDCPENSIALYAGESGTRDYTFSGRSQVGYTVVGNPTISNGVVSGFLAYPDTPYSGYYVNTSEGMNFNDDFEIYIRFRIDSQPSGNSALIGRKGSGFYFALNTSTVLLSLINQSGVDFYTSYFSVSSSFQLSVWYTCLLNKNNNSLQMLITEENSNTIILNRTIALTDIIRNGPIAFGVTIGDVAYQAFPGSIDLNETYIKINGEYWFNGAAKLTGASDSLYLENDGSERYIDTGILLNNNCKIEATCALSSSALTADHGWRLAGSYYDNAGFGLGTGSADQNPLFRYAAQAPSLVDYNMKDTNKHTLVLDKENAYFDGTLVYTFVPTTFQNTGTNTAGIFSRRQSSNQDYWNGKVYRCRFWDDTGTLVGDFVPVPAGFVAGSVYCPTNGMFDIVEQKFYSNQGTGNFTYGRDGSALNYDNLGFTATCVGGYKVYIDGEHYGTYTSASQCNIIWSQSEANGGDDITTPSTLKAHKIWIEPATSGNNITVFQCKRVAASGREEQGILWAHFNLTNAIKIIYAFGNETQAKNALLEAVTAKNNLITYNVSSGVQSGFYSSFCDSTSLKYLPILKAENQTYPSGVYNALRGVPVKKVVIKNNNGGETFAILNQTNVEEFVIENGLTLGSSTSSQGDAHRATNLKKFPKINQNKAENFQMYNCPALEPVNIDDRFNDIRKVFRFYGTQSVPTPALKSLRVSNEAPFDNDTAPQINVNYTGMDRDALVQLFNDLPYNVGYTVAGSPGPTIENGIASGFSADDYLQVERNLGSTNIGTKIETKCKFTTGTIGEQGIIGVSANYGANGFRIISSGKLEYRILALATDDLAQKGFNCRSNITLEASTTYEAYAVVEGRNITLNIYNDSGTLLDTATLQIDDGYTELYNYYQFRIGRTQNGVFTGSINLNNTYIKINDEYWFRGQPAMTKTLSCVGATGTADLTAEDKAIATDKGWALTLAA